MELHDPHMIGGRYTWFRGPNHPGAARLDRFFFSMEWEETFNNIRQKKSPKGSNFKFESWWLKVEGFNEMVQNWWDEFVVPGCPDYKHSSKLRMLKHKLEVWSRATFGEMRRTICLKN
ncbi:hypothetical protein H5410_004174 [Solanum commersonii]|uniref:Uncharacterized protein n=1 Tax=Solanum commersonii TaxID=4109 RepID=A0A9J6B708_SOLCO|nr:hypothetical protein H5410_004174 [Solanum commersonii]